MSFNDAAPKQHRDVNSDPNVIFLSTINMEFIVFGQHSSASFSVEVNPLISGVVGLDDDNDICIEIANMFPVIMAIAI
jgi:hypothetical protein